MKITRLTFIVVLLCSGISVQAQKDGAQTFKLNDCIAYALKNNQATQIKKLDEYIATAKMQEAVGIGLPQVSASANTTNNYIIPTTPLPAEIVGGNSGEFIPVQFSTKYSGAASLSAEQLIFNGSYFVGLKAAKTFLSLSEKQTEASEIDVIANVTTAYYLILVNKARLDLVETNYFRLDTLLKETKLIYENGLSEKIDVNRVQIEFNNITYQRKATIEILALSYATLKFQMGMPINQELIIPDKLEDIEFDPAALLVAKAEPKERIEYSILNTQYELSNFDMKNNQARYMPVINLFGTLGTSGFAQQSSELFNFDQNWFGSGAIGLKLNWTLFDGLIRERKIQQTKLQMQQINLRKSLLVNNVDLEVAQSKVNLQNALEEIDAQRQNMELAKEVYEVSRIKYGEGVGSSLEVIDADTAYKNAQAAYFDAMYTGLVSIVSLEKALGVLKNEN